MSSATGLRLASNAPYQLSTAGEGALPPGYYPGKALTALSDLSAEQKTQRGVARPFSVSGVSGLKRAILAFGAAAVGFDWYTDLSKRKDEPEKEKGRVRKELQKNAAFVYRGPLIQIKGDTSGSPEEGNGMSLSQFKKTLTSKPQYKKDFELYKEQVLKDKDGARCREGKWALHSLRGWERRKERGVP